MFTVYSAKSLANRFHTDSGLKGQKNLAILIIISQGDLQKIKVKKNNNEIGGRGGDAIQSETKP